MTAGIKYDKLMSNSNKWGSGCAGSEGCGSEGCGSEGCRGCRGWRLPAGMGSRQKGPAQTFDGAVRQNCPAQTPGTGVLRECSAAGFRIEV